METETLEPAALLDALADLLTPRIVARLPVPSLPPLKAEADEVGADLWWTTKRAAKRWSLKPAYLENLRVSGGGPPFIKVGNIVRYNIVDGDAWLASKKRSSTAGGPLAEVKPLSSKSGRRA